VTVPPTFDAAFGERLVTLLRWRRDVRRFRAQRVPEAEMQALFAAAALAPSVGNAQPWRFVRLRSPAIRQALAMHVDRAAAAAAAALPDAERRVHHARLKLHGLREAPELLAVFSDEAAAAGHGLGRATMPETLRYSTVMAIHTLWLAARARGIGVGWVSILEPRAVARLLETPADWQLIALLCIGYPEAPSNEPELEAQGWQSREPIADRILER
jgi:5,6-dimethylbenzimidazole synthase